MPDRRHSATQIEGVLRELRGVCGARVVADENGLIQEIHLLVEADRNPKQAVRDVESALLAHFGIHIDHRKVSVAQKGSASKLTDPNRLRWLDVQISHEGTRAVVAVLLERNGTVYRGGGVGRARQHTDSASGRCSNPAGSRGGVWVVRAVRAGGCLHHRDCRRLPCGDCAGERSARAGRRPTGGKCADSPRRAARGGAGDAGRRESARVGVPRRCGRRPLSHTVSEPTAASAENDLGRA
jgi:hypothetical protein